VRTAALDRRAVATNSLKLRDKKIRDMGVDDS